MDAAAAEAKVGRPRSAEADDAIYAATIAEILDKGIEGFTVESLAERAGVGKATIYRRFASRDELLVSVMQRCARDEAVADPPADTGSLHGDLRAVVDRLVGLLTKTDMGRLFPRLVCEASEGGRFGELRTRFKQERRQPGIDAIERAKARGEVRAEVDPDAALDLLVGPVFTRFLLGHATFPTRWRDDLVDLVARALA